MSRASQYLSCLLFASLLVACGAEQTADETSAADAQSGANAGDGSNDASAAKPAGPPFAVGTTTIKTIGANGRELPTDLWYPIKTGTQGDPARYFLGLLASPFGAVRDAEPAGGPYPLVAFSHGHSGVRDQSVFLVEYLARWGYVVVSPEHVGNSFPTMKDEWNQVMPLWRPQDLKAAIDQVVDLGADDPDWLDGLVDASKIAAIGHSFGGYTALALAGLPVQQPKGVKINCDRDKDSLVCKEIAKLGPAPWDFGDDRIDMVIPLAHALYGNGALSKTVAKEYKKPVIVMAASGDTTTPYNTEAVPLYADLPGPAALLTIEGGSHFSFADICHALSFAPSQYKASMEAACGPNAKPTQTQSQEIVRNHVLAALDVFLKGKDEQRAVFADAKSADGLYTMASKGIVGGNK